MVPEARLERGVPQSAGWFVVNARETRWTHNEMGWYCNFEGQEDFLVLRGECLLIVEGKERPLRHWDFFHCPPFTKHVILGAGDGPSVVLAVGVRGKGHGTFPVDEVAVRHGAGVREATTSAREAYTGYSEPKEVPAPKIL